MCSRTFRHIHCYTRMCVSFSLCICGNRTTQYDSILDITRMLSIFSNIFLYVLSIHFTWKLCAFSWIVTTKCNVRTYASTTIAFPYTLLQWNTLWISIHKTSDGNSTLTCIIRPIFVSLTLVEMGKVTEHLTFLFLLIYLSDVYQFSKSV